MTRAKCRRRSSARLGKSQGSMRRVIRHLTQIAPTNRQSHQEESRDWRQSPLCAGRAIGELGRDRADVPPNYRSPNRDRALGRILGFLRSEFGSATCDKRGIGVPGDFVQPARRYWRFVVAYGRVFTRPHFPPRKGFGACRSALDRRFAISQPLQRFLALMLIELPGTILPFVSPALRRFLPQVTMPRRGRSRRPTG